MKTKSESIDVALEQTLDHRELVPGISAYSLTRRVVAKSPAPKWMTGAINEFVATGLAKTAAVKKFLSGAREAIEPAKGFILCSPEYLKRVQEYGYCAPESDKAMGDLLRAVNAAPLHAPAGWCVVRDDFSGHMLFDTEGRPLPVGLVYNYLSGNVRDGCYDMDRLVPYLNAHPQVRPCLNSPAEQVTRLEVPYYNVSPGCTVSANFVFAPTQEQMLQIWECAKTLNKKYPSTVLHEAVFALDIIGLRAAGIARGDTYYGVSSDD